MASCFSCLQTSHFPVEKHWETPIHHLLCPWKRLPSLPVKWIFYAGSPDSFHIQTISSQFFLLFFLWSQDLPRYKISGWPHSVLPEDHSSPPAPQSLARAHQAAGQPSSPCAQATSNVDTQVHPQNTSPAPAWKWVFSAPKAQHGEKNQSTASASPLRVSTADGGLCHVWCDPFPSGDLSYFVLVVVRVFTSLYVAKCVSLSLVISPVTS